jgi:NAD(P)-dependent dehydrogenase (short-subunit alcohol dehydrogenase family)
MELAEGVSVVTGGASGLGLATVKRIAATGAPVVIVDLPVSNGAEVAGQLGGNVHFVAADVADEDQMTAAIAKAESLGPVRVAVNCAGRGGALRILDSENAPGSLAHFETIIRVNLIGSFNLLRLAAASMAKNVPAAEERGVVILTASIAAYEGQIGQIPYASSKAGIVGMTLVAARDLASRQIRVCTIAPGVFDTPILARIPPEVKEKLGQAVPHPARLGRADEFAALAAHIVANPMLNGETIRLDGALRMPPR